MVSKIILFMLITLMAGCAAYEPPTPGLEHPANPDAPAGSFKSLPPTLDLDIENLPSPPPEMQKQDAMPMGLQPCDDIDESLCAGSERERPDYA